jgi:hypothetical protein
MEKFKMALLAIACLFMAGLNLWNEFKDWFDKTYQRKDKKPNNGKDTSENKTTLDERGIPDIIGKSKTVLHSRKEPEQTKEKDEDKEIEKDENPPVHSMYLEKEKNASETTEPLTSEEDIPIVTTHTKDNAALSGGQSFTFDEFGLLAKTLQGKPVSAYQRDQVPEIRQRVQGTNLYEQFIGQVKGAEDIASAILRKADELEGNKSTSLTPASGNLSKFIRT